MRPYLLSQCEHEGRDAGKEIYQCNQHISLGTSLFQVCVHGANQWTSEGTAGTLELSVNIIFVHWPNSTGPFCHNPLEVSYADPL
jgi:hypothetical protein